MDWESDHPAQEERTEIIYLPPRGGGSNVSAVKNEGLSFTAMRRSNLSAVLRKIHYTGSISRRDLTEHLGLNRSTVIDLVGELIDLGLLTEEVAPVEGPRKKGRPTLHLRPDTSVVALALYPDVDGIRVSLVALGGQEIATEFIPTAHAPGVKAVLEHAAVSMERLAGKVVGAVRCVGVCLATSGMVDVGNGVVKSAPHLGWDEVPFGALLEQATGLPTRVVSSAGAATQAELLFGAGQGVSDLVYLHGGESGIDGGIILGGVAVTGMSGFAGQVGQNFLSPPTGTAGRTTGRTFDDEINRRALLRALGMRGSTDEDLAAALDGDNADAARRVLRHQVGVLSLGVASFVNLLNPAVILLGGYLGVLLEQERAYLTTLVRRQAVRAAYSDVRIEPAALGSRGVMVGAGEAVFAAVLDAPELIDEVLAKRSA